MPGTMKAATLSPRTCESLGELIGSATSTTLVLNADSKTKTGTNNTAVADSQYNPHGVLAGTVLNHANVLIATIPPGSSILDLCHEYTGSAPGVSPIVRCYVEVPERGTNIDANNANKVWPNDFNVGFFNPGADANTSDWKPAFSAKTGNHAITLTGTAQANGTSIRSEVQSINVLGGKRVMVVIDTAATTSTLGCIIGWFGS